MEAIPSSRRSSCVWMKLATLYWCCNDYQYSLSSQLTLGMLLWVRLMFWSKQCNRDERKNGTLRCRSDSDSFPPVRLQGVQCGWFSWLEGWRSLMNSRFQILLRPKAPSKPQNWSFCRILLVVFLTFFDSKRLNRCFAKLATNSSPPRFSTASWLFPICFPFDWTTSPSGHCSYSSSFLCFSGSNRRFLSSLWWYCASFLVSCLSLSLSHFRASHCFHGFHRFYGESSLLFASILFAPHDWSLFGR